MLRADPLPFIARRLGRKPSATADLYLGFCCADLIADGRIEQFAPTVFRAGRTLIVLRHDAGLVPLPAHERLIWLIDDDVPAGIGDAELPLWYRLRLAVLEARAARRLARAADRIVVPGPSLAAVLAARGIARDRMTILPPAWPASAAPLPDPVQPPRRIAWLGAASHARDTQRAAAILRLVLQDFPETAVIWSANNPAPPDLAHHPGFERVPPLDWHSYRKWLGAARFDIGLYPIGGQGFNRGRSANKLGEYDQAGAAVLASTAWRDAEAAAAAGACLLLPPEPAAWRDAIRALHSDPARLHALAAANRLWQAEHGFGHQRRIWSDLLPGTDFSASRSASARSVP
ncbi:hypothetical protein [Paenirhodobacter populi]|uniref:Glycosyltransferase family 1 protein n=1 Tax=Paenirhodobacter populi TaxID=2306993 RepID=A0A443JMK3_9RHOB|nr:hypothetical protein [Sinirhodobacter populi]RWR21740.1 hypothetical protein D2T30_08405 [Sinirhodobacter populi]